MDIKPIDPVNRPFFAGVVSGLDLRQPLSPEEVAAVQAGMDEYAVLVFHDQPIDDEQQIVFSRNFGALEQRDAATSPAPRTGGCSVGPERHLQPRQEQRVLARDDRRAPVRLGNRLWHSDSSFRAIPAKYSLLSARVIPPAGGNTEFADMRAAYDALDAETKARGRGPGLRALA